MVALEAASRSSGVPGRMKWETSAMWTPTSSFSGSMGRQWRASSMSVQPGGSTEQMSRWRKSTRLVTSFKISG